MLIAKRIDQLLTYTSTIKQILLKSRRLISNKNKKQPAIWIRQTI